MRHFCKSLFPVVDYAYCTIPTYPSGQIGFMLCSKNPVSRSGLAPRGGEAGAWQGGQESTSLRQHPCPQSTNFREPLQPLMQKQVEEMQLKYYNSDVHRAAFVLPEFARKVRPPTHTPRRAGGTQGSLKGHLAHPPSPAPS